MTLKECFAVRDLDTFAAAFAHEVGSVDRTRYGRVRRSTNRSSPTTGSSFARRP